MAQEKLAPDFVAAIARRAGIENGQAEATIAAMVQEIEARLAKGDSVILPGLGKFAVEASEPVRGVNPVTGVRIDVPGTRMPRFLAAKSLKDSINR